MGYKKVCNCRVRNERDRKDLRELNGGSGLRVRRESFRN